MNLYIVYEKYYNKLFECMTIDTPHMIGTENEVKETLQVKYFNYNKSSSLKGHKYNKDYKGLKLIDTIKNIVHETEKFVVCKI